MTDDAVEPRSFLIHSAWRGVIASYVSAAIFLLLAIWSFVGGGVSVIFVILALIAVALTAIAVLDYPIAVGVTPDGLVRRCLGRRQLLAWSQVEQITRTADVASSAAERGRIRRGRGPGGLVAVIGRRRYLLTNQSENRDEFHALRTAVSAWGPDVRLVATLPLEDQPPTWLYRRPHHRPPDADVAR